MNPGADREMTEAVRRAINELPEPVCQEAGIEREEILNATFVGNPIIHHQLLCIDPMEIGVAPFARAATSGISQWASDPDLRFHHNDTLYTTRKDSCRKRGCTYK